MTFFFGCSFPIQWRPLWTNDPLCVQLCWFVFEIGFLKSGLVPFARASFIHIISEELDAAGGEVTYRRETDG